MTPPTWLVCSLRKMVADRQRKLDEQERQIAKERRELEKLNELASQFEEHVYAEQQSSSPIASIRGKDQDRPEC